jgi:hypothetical protein
MRLTSSVLIGATTPKGKIDRKRFPPPGPTRAADSVVGVDSPTSIVEQKIAVVLCDALGIALPRILRRPNHVLNLFAAQRYVAQASRSNHDVPCRP